MLTVYSSLQPDKSLTGCQIITWCILFVFEGKLVILKLDTVMTLLSTEPCSWPSDLSRIFPTLHTTLHNRTLLTLFSCDCSSTSQSVPSFICLFICTQLEFWMLLCTKVLCTKMLWTKIRLIKKQVFWALPSNLDI